MRAARPADEDARLAAVAALAWRAQARDAGLDDIVTLAAERFGAPISIISLTEKERQTAIASFGAAAVSAPRDSTFCAHTVASGAMLVIPDALDDPSFASNPFVLNPPHVRFYAGAPLRSEEGYCLGALCVIDTKPRAFSVAEQESLARLARMAERRMLERDLRARVMRAERESAEVQGRFNAMLSEAAGAFAACDRLALNLGSRVRASVARAQRANERGGGHVLDNELAVLSEVVNELIAVARLDRDAVVGPTLIEPSAVLRDVVSAARPLARERGIALDLEDGAAGVEMLCDSWRLEELLESLLDDCLALSRAHLQVSCSFAPSANDGRCRFIVRLSSTSEGPPWRIGARNRDLIDIMAGAWELDQSGRRIGVHLPARLRSTNAAPQALAPDNVVPFDRTKRGRQ